MAILQQIKVPLISVNDRSLTVVETPFATGDAIKEGDIILVFETSKTTYDVIAETNGYIQYDCLTGLDYEVNETIAVIVSEITEVKIAPAFKKTDDKNNNEHIAEIWDGETIFSKGAIELLQSNNINKNEFAHYDFINKDDVLIYLGKDVKNNQKVFNKKLSKTITPEFDIKGTTLKKLTVNKKREIEYLRSVQLDGLTSTINTFIDTSEIFTHLNQSLKILKNSLLPVTIYEVSRLLNKYKKLNAFYSDGAIYYYDSINVGFAIDIGEGLKVLKVQDATHKSLHNIEEEIINLSEKYLDNTIHIDDLTDITFTITDLSAETVASFRPLINFQNSAILGISSIDEKLERCMFSVTFDHRVTEGKLVANFLKEIKDRLESYRSIGTEKSLNKITCFKCHRSLEEDLGDVGFANIITPKGETAFICQSCFKGF